MIHRYLVSAALALHCTVSAASPLGDLAASTLGQNLEAVQLRLTQRHLDTVPGTQSRHLETTSGGQTREALVIEPTEVTGSAPAIVLLHYNGGNSYTMANATDAGRWAAENGAFVIMPEAAGRKWNDNPALDTGVDDVAYLRDVIENAKRTLPIDPERIYMAGMSNGGFMVERFACQHGTLLAGAAVIAATVRNSQLEECAFAPAVPMMIVQGTWDLVVPYSHPIAMLPAREHFAFWAQRNGCDQSGAVEYPIPDQLQDGTTTTVTRVDDCNSGAPVALYTVDHGGHTWPKWTPGVSTYYLGLTAKDWGATEELWQVLSPYRANLTP